MDKATGGSGAVKLACDCCDKAIERGIPYSKSWRELPFASFPYVLCGSCLDQYADSYPAMAYLAILTRAGRRSESWAREVEEMLAAPTLQSSHRVELASQAA